MKYIFAFLGFIVIVVVVIVLIFSGGSDKKNAKKVIQLSDYATKTASRVEYIVEGPINAEENHRLIRISVSDSSRTIDVMKGYQGEILRTKTYDNSDEAYQQFLDALSRAGYLNSRKTKAIYDGVCPTGSRSLFKLIEGSRDVSSAWSASCNKGTFAGNKSLVKSLFELQIPEYSKITTDVPLGSTSASIF